MEDALVPTVDFLQSTGQAEDLVIKERIQQLQYPLRMMSYNPNALIITELNFDEQQAQNDFDSDGQGVTRIVFSGYFNRWCMVKQIRGLDQRIVDSFRSDGIDIVPQPLAVQAANNLKNPQRGIESTDLLALSKEMLPHPNIISLLCFLSPSQDKQGITAVVTEAAEDGTVEFSMKRGFVVKDELLLRWTYQLALALDYCHSVHRIIHRDINPTHVYVFEGGRTVKLGDFFFSRKNPDGPSSANKSDRLAFSAPETFNASELAHYSFSADIWSLAMLMYYISHGMKEPYDKKLINNRDEAKRQIYNGLRPSLRENLQPTVRQIIEACWVNEKRTADGREIISFEQLRPTANQIARGLENAVPDLSLQ